MNKSKNRATIDPSRCPACGATLDEDAAICPSCDHIVDASFLEDSETSPGEEDTDPRLQMPAGLEEDEGTDPGSKAVLGADDLSDERYTEEPSQNSRNPSSRSDYGQSREVVTDTSPLGIEAQARGSTSKEHQRGGPVGGMDPNSSSQLMDDYDSLFTDLWQRFLKVSLADKLLLCGLVLALMAVLLPWRAYVHTDGTYEVRSGISVGGWVTILLAGGMGAMFWLRFFQEGGDRLEWLLAQLGISGAGVAWSIIAFLIGLRVGATAPDFGGPSAGPVYGVVVSMLAWSIAGAGATLLLMDALATKSRRGSRRPTRG